ncbi:serine protease HTRA2, mitochondrial-like [Diabrotica virgifera virgifera]|uniref:Serine protease HTRA2, mitochondrial n=1 Tax=Diabrotica virgifera virgifera TaxID=50390 RepID=A0ABM5KBZ3_DIAVI|nr:serine protease HTRA2, mitochondrial-like [Diabrotica virgifera virgifera]
MSRRILGMFTKCLSNCTTSYRYLKTIKNLRYKNPQLQFIGVRNYGRYRNTSTTSRSKKIAKFGVPALILTSLYFIRKFGKAKESKNKLNQYRKDMGELTRSHSTDTITSLPAAPAENGQNLRERYNFINKVVTQCAPAVFYLEIRDPVKKDIDGLPLITSNGSGFIISDDGWALTNAHVILNKPQSIITAVLRDGTSYNVNVEDMDMNIDLALLKLDVKDKVPSLKFGQDDTSVGEWVVALGSPLSLSNSVTVGIISCVNRPAQDLGLKNDSMSYIQTDAAITFGNSGGPLVNLDGNVIGINNLRLTSGISFAIPVEYAKKFLENGKYRVKGLQYAGPMGKNLFGITTISITPEVVSELLRNNKDIPKDIKQGLLVWKILPGTAAFKGGLKAGDIITHINDIPVSNPADLYSSSDYNKTVKVSLIQEGKKKTIFLYPEMFIEEF